MCMHMSEVTGVFECNLFLDINTGPLHVRRTSVNIKQQMLHVALHYGCYM